MPILMFGNQIVGGASGMEGIPIKPISQAEYDALSDEQKNSETAWLVTDAEGGEGGSAASTIGEVYSSEEIRVGVWKDGKPLYRRTFEGTSPSVNTVWTEIFTDEFDGSDVDTYVTLRGFCDVTSDGMKMAIPYGNSNVNVFFLAISANNRLVAYVEGNKRSIPFRLILEYTKTTDTPMGSIPTLDTPPLEIYDGEERVIGTWFGKPLYEKVFVFTSPNQSGETAMVPFDGTIEPRMSFNYQRVESIAAADPLPVFNGTNYARVGVNTTGIIWNSNTSLWGGRIITSIVRYTKTTD